MTGDGVRARGGSAPTAPADPLEPLRRVLLDRARQDAARAVAEAAAQVADRVAEARREAEAMLAEARDKGRREGAAVAAADRGRAAREARAQVLAARREAYCGLRDRARAEVGRLRHDPRYPELRSALAERARRELGPRAAIREDPSGGIVGQGEGRAVVLSLAELADGALEELGAEVERLWTP